MRQAAARRRLPAAFRMALFMCQPSALRPELHAAVGMRRPHCYAGVLQPCPCCAVTPSPVPPCARAVVAPAAVPEFLPALAELARMQHFAHAANLHETIWKQLPAIAENVGKKVGARVRGASVPALGGGEGWGGWGRRGAGSAAALAGVNACRAEVHAVSSRQQDASPEGPLLAEAEVVCAQGGGG